MDAQFAGLQEFENLKKEVAALKARSNEHHGSISYFKGLIKLLCKKLNVNPNTPEGL